MKMSIAAILLSLVLGSCRHRPLQKAELIAYVNNPDNGLKKEQQAGNIRATLTYKPWALMTGAGFKNKLFFVLSLSANNKELLRQLSFDQYSEMVQVLAFR